jgi:hypothetical protein
VTIRRAAAMTVSIGYTYIAQGEAPDDLVPKLIPIGEASAL